MSRATRSLANSHAAPSGSMSAAQKLATAFHGERSSIPTISSSEKPANTPRAALYTQHGPSNRLTLSLTSGISEECDFALDRLLRISAIDPSIFLLEHFPGLTEALCTTIDLAPSCTPNPHFQSTHTETRLRQAANAAIVLRNVAAEPDNLLHLWQRPQVLPTLIHTLERTAPFDARVPSHAQLARDTTQLHATLLDIFAVFAPYITLQSSPATTTDDASEADESEEPQRKRQKRLGPVSHHVQSLFPRIYPLVSRLCWSSDRALVISAYYILAALATSLNASTFTFNAHVDTLEAPNPVSRALELLPLNDLDLISATLQFLFCYTDISSKNADSLASRKDILHILRMLLNKSMLAGVRHDMVTGPPKPVSKAKQQAALSGFPKGAGFLPPAEMQLLCMLAEPQRTTLWCQWMYISQPSAEMKQRELWETYKNQFNSSPVAPPVSPPEFLNMMQAALDHKIAVVKSPVDQSYVVRGIQERDRKGMASMLRKHWSANGPPSYLKGNPNSLPEDALLLAAFKSLLANAGAGDVLQTDKVPSSESRFPIFEPRNSESLPVGHSLYAILVLRNMSRAIRSAIVPVKQSKDDQVLSYLTPFGETEDDPTDTFVHGASQGKDAILQMEEELLNLAMNSRILGSYLGDIMGDIAAIRKTLMSSAHQPAT